MNFRNLVLVFSLLLASCSSETSGSDPRQKVLESWWYDWFEPELQALTASTKELETASAQYCDTPTPERLDTTQDAWLNANRNLKRMAPFYFGPFTEEPERFKAELDFWPSRPDSIESLLAEDSAFTAESIAALGSATKGLPVADYLLWSSTTPADNEQRCQFLTGLTGASHVAAQGLNSAWDPAAGGYYSQLLRPGSDSEFKTVTLSVSALINRMWFTIENIRMERLGKPLGTTSGGTPQPDLAESRFSKTSIAAINHSLDGVEELYWGGQAHGISQFVDPSINAAIETEFKASRAALDAIGPSLGVAVVDDSEAVQHAIDELERLQILFAVDVISDLGLSASFNDTDGD